MADTPVIHIGENSPERIAYLLMRDIAIVERKVFNNHPADGAAKADRKWILDTYAECIRAIRDPHMRSP